MDHSDAPLVDRCNGAPPILRGLTANELLWVVGMAVLFWLVPAIVLWQVTDLLVLAVALLFSAPAVTVWLLAGWFQSLKRDRPQDYHLLLAKRWLARHLRFREHFVSHRGSWDLGRSLLNPAQARRRAKRAGATR